MSYIFAENWRRKDGEAILYVFLASDELTKKEKNTKFETFCVIMILFAHRGGGKMIKLFWHFWGDLTFAFGRFEGFGIWNFVFLSSSTVNTSTVNKVLLSHFYLTDFLKKQTKQSTDVSSHAFTPNWKYT